jgi:hypothetical protein
MAAGRGSSTGVRVARAVMASIALVLFTSAARAEVFDLVTFEPPPGVRQALPDVVGFSESTPTTFVTYAVYKSARSSGDPARDFQDERMLLMGQYRLTGDLRSETTDWPGGWKLTMGTARVWGEQQRNFVSVLSVFTGHGVKASVLINYNDDAYKPKIDRFVASLRLRAPVGAGNSPAAPISSASASGAVATAPVQAAGSATSLTSNEWYRSVASTWDTSGYLRYRYRFLADGTYSFMKEWWSQYHHTDYWFIEESGRYAIEGAVIRIAPDKALKILRDKAGNQRGKPEAVPLEAVSYRYIFKDLYKPTLILTPTTGRTTERDGQMFSFAGDGKSYYYEPPSRCEQRPTPADCP